MVLLTGKSILRFYQVSAQLQTTSDKFLHKSPNISIHNSPLTGVTRKGTGGWLSNSAPKIGTINQLIWSQNKLLTGELINQPFSLWKGIAKLKYIILIKR